MTAQRGVQAFYVALLLLLLAAAWMAFAPTQFGGQVSYAIVAGDSMWPTLRQGDLAVLRRVSAYRVNDIVAYRDPQVGPIIHRVVARQGDRFVFKGDYNDYLDPHQPAQAELIGKLWLRLPVVGRYVEQVRTPQGLTLVAAVIGTVIMTAVMTPTDRAHGRRQRARAGTASRQLGVNTFDLLLVLGAVAVASLALAVFAFTRPSYQSVSESVHYQQTGVFSYSAPAPPGVYDLEVVQPGEPIFRQLIDKVEIAFEYQLAADLPVQAQGTYRLLAEIGGISGWKRTLVLQPETAFSGHTFVATSVIDLSAIQAVIDEFERQVGIQHNRYTLTIIPQVALDGELAGRALEDRFAPRLVFELDDLQMGLVRTGEADPLRPVQSGQLSQTVVRPNRLSFLGASFDVSAVRRISMILLACSVAAVEVVGLSTLYHSRAGEAARIQIKYDSMLVPVEGGVEVNADGRSVNVSSIDGLARIAEASGSMILHQTRGRIDYYFVQSGDVLYCYRAHGDGEE